MCLFWPSTDQTLVKHSVDTCVSTIDCQLIRIKIYLEQLARVPIKWRVNHTQSTAFLGCNYHNSSSKLEVDTPSVNLHVFGCVSKTSISKRNNDFGKALVFQKWSIKPIRHMHYLLYVNNKQIFFNHSQAQKSLDSKFPNGFQTIARYNWNIYYQSWS